MARPTISDMVPTYLHLILSSLFPIYIASHASLSRPSSAAKPSRQANGEKSGDDEEEEEEEVYQKLEGLAPSDAIIFPIIAGLTLGGLYLLIKWLEDPSILNLILGWYFGAFGTFGIAQLVGDVLSFTHSLVFPKLYRDQGVLWKIDGQAKTVVPLPAGTASSTSEAPPTRHSPLPGALGRISLPRKLNSMLWSSRAFAQKITFKVYLREVGARRVHVSPFSIFGFVIGLAVALYSNLVARPWWLTNLSGFAFSYSALQLMSPTTFTTGSMLLAALFCYDIYMVFYTPMMVTVARALEVPIKLEFPRPAAPGEDPKKAGNAMLGLGDIVIPGLMIGLALRFDLYLHYLKKQKPSTAIQANGGTGSSETVEKPAYVSPGKNWSTHFWTTSWSGSSANGNALKTGAFRKTYFHTSLTGYVLGMLSTLAGMEYSNHPQPALLYLVPAVVGSLWLVAFIKREVKFMYGFTEAVEEEGEADNTGKDKQTKGESEKTTETKGKSSFFSFASQQKNEEILDSAISRHFEEGDSGSEHSSAAGSSEGGPGPKRRTSAAKAKRREDSFRRDKGRDWFYFAVSSYAPVKKKTASESKIVAAGVSSDHNDNVSEVQAGANSTASGVSTTGRGEDEQAPKRRRHA